MQHRQLSVSQSSYHASNKEILSLLQKYCTRDACYGKAKLSEELFQRFQATEKFISDQLKASQPEDDSVITAESSIMLIMSNVAAAQKESKRSLHAAVQLRSTRYEADTACSELSKYWLHHKYMREAVNTKASQKYAKLSLLFIILLIVTIIVLLFCILPSLNRVQALSKAPDEPQKTFLFFIPIGDKPIPNSIKYSGQIALFTVLFIVGLIASIVFSLLSCYLYFYKRRQSICHEAESAFLRSDIQIVLSSFRSTSLLVNHSEEAI